MRSECGADHSPASGIEVKSERTYASNPPMCHAKVRFSFLSLNTFASKRIQYNIIHHPACLCTIFDVKYAFVWFCVCSTPTFVPLELLLNPLKAELNPICYLLALLGAHNFLHVSRIRVKSLTLRQVMLYIYGAPILDVCRSHTTTHHSR